MLFLVSAVFLLVLGKAAVVFLIQFRALGAKCDPYARDVDPDRYRPLVRLLQDADRDVSRSCIRKNLRSLRDDYATLLAQVRLILAESPTERPDLAKTLARNRLLFATALCRIEVRLWLRSVGIGRADMVAREVLALVDGTKALHLRAAFLCESAVWGA